nr:hypothetical protein [Halimeda borneensis]
MLLRNNTSKIFYLSPNLIKQLVVDDRGKDAFDLYKLTSAKLQPYINVALKTAKIVVGIPQIGSQTTNILTKEINSFFVTLFSHFDFILKPMKEVKMILFGLHYMLTDKLNACTHKETKKTFYKVLV